MILTALTPILQTEHLLQTIGFYCDNLGFRTTAYTEAWASLERDGIELMLSLPNQHEPYAGPSFSGSFYFRCDDVDVWWESLKDKAPVVYPIENFDYGMREFAIRDNNGYILQFGKPLTDEELVGDEFGPAPTVESALQLTGQTLFAMTQPIVSIMGYAQFAQEKLDPAHPAARDIDKICKLADVAEESLKHLADEIRRMRERSIAIPTKPKPEN